MRTTLNKIRAHHPCTDGWTKLLRNLGKTQADDGQDRYSQMCVRLPYEADQSCVATRTAAIAALRDRLARPVVPHAEPQCSPMLTECPKCKNDFRRCPMPAAPAVPLTDEPCKWVQDGEGEDVWATSCRHRFRLDDGSPSDHKLRHCCYCGKRLVDVPYTEEGER